MVELSNVIGKLVFVDTPKIYNMGSVLEGKVGERDDLQVCEVRGASVILWDASFLDYYRLKWFTTMTRPSLTSRSSY